MSRHLSKKAIVTAFQKLSYLTEDPTKQGQTQKTSALRYMFALDGFKKKYEKDCDIKDQEDKRRYVEEVGKVVSINEHISTTNFYNKFVSSSDYSVGSNFFSVNVVKESKVSPDKEFRFPQRGPELFKIKNQQLLVETICYNNLSHYLSSIQLREAFVIWLLRNEVFKDNEDEEKLKDILKRRLTENYSYEMVEELFLPGLTFDSYSKKGKIELFSSEEYSLSEDDFTNKEPEKLCSHNLIYFGAPGTGKSYQLNMRAIGNEEVGGLFDTENVRRVTFHPDYTYAQFVGCFKPHIVPKIDDESPVSAIEYASGEIEYKFVPGPFIRTYVDAIRHPEQNYLLIIEELNRANAAAVFGDTFQLLDRKADGSSEYSIVTSEDLYWYLFKHWKSFLNSKKFHERNGVHYSLDDPEAKTLASSITLPSNMYIWATMNSADQGVYPMDTAFKRRWSFQYMEIDDGEEVIKDMVLPLGKTGRKANWNDMRHVINNMLREAHINEDKLLGPFFIDPDLAKDENELLDIFKSKVLLYLIEDAAKTKKEQVFGDRNITYSVLLHKFDEKGEEVFPNHSSLKYIEEEQEITLEEHAQDAKQEDER